MQLKWLEDFVEFARAAAARVCPPGLTSRLPGL
ncbi:hypothetical protein J2785_002672 [Burkholderia ambifaria]|nr:hypothetical protein [Burkholderia ambifaria]